MRKALLAGALLLAAAATPAMATDVATFLVTVESARQNKLKALMSGDAARMMREIGTAAKELKAERLRAEAAGRRGAYCPKGAASLSQQELIAAVYAVPPAERPRVQVKEAIRRGLARKYPCGV